jgi:hypothetical protein
MIEFAASYVAATDGQAREKLTNSIELYGTRVVPLVNDMLA